MIKRTELSFVFLTGGVIYGLVEIIWRGYTHWSMIIAGGICFTAIHLLNKKLSDTHILLKCAAGCLFITGVEFVIGVIVNLILRLNVWDYSGVFGNLFGQICPVFTAMWFLISYPAFLLSSTIDKFYSLIAHQKTTEYGEA